MHEAYEYRTLRARPRELGKALEQIRGRGVSALERAGGAFFGLWTGQIGLGSDEAVAISLWPGASDASPILEGVEGLEASTAESLVATLRPTDPTPPKEPGVYAHRWFEILERDWEEFLALSEAAWPDFEPANDARVIGFWRSLDVEAPNARVLLLTRYPSLAVWEGSRREQSPDPQSPMWKRFLRRHALTRSTRVVTTRLVG